MIRLNYPKFWQSKNLISCILIPFSWLYIFLGFLRKIFTKEIRLPGKVICIGNMTVGGSGKTQIVEFFANYLTKKKISFVIITKGYGSKIGNDAILLDHTHRSIDVGDESICLFRKGYRVIAAKKIQSTIALLKKLKPQIIIVDDGMQNPGFYKDFQVLTIDNKRNIDNGMIFPAGPLRESPAKSIHKSDLICVIGVNDNNLDLKINHNKPIFYAQTKMVTKLETAKRYIAFSGIGNPDKFFDMLKQNNIKLCDIISYPDHHMYQDTELDQLMTSAQKHDAILLTTQKDFVKIPQKYNIIPVDVELVFRNQIELEKLIDEKII